MIINFLNLLLDLIVEIIPRFITEKCLVRVETEDGVMVIVDSLPVQFMEEGDEEHFDGTAHLKCLAWLGVGWIPKLKGSITFWDGTVFPEEQ